MKKDTKQRLFEIMSRLDKTFKPKLNEVYPPPYERLDPPDDYWGDDDERAIEPETPELKTNDFRVYGNIEDDNVSSDYHFLYTVWEINKDSEFGNILSKVDLTSSPMGEDWGWNNMGPSKDGLRGADFIEKDIPEIVRQLKPYMNVKSISDFVNYIQKLPNEMRQWEEDYNEHKSYIGGDGYDYDGPDEEPPYDSSHPDNAWMDYIN